MEWWIWLFLIIFDLTNYFNYQTRFNGFLSRNNISRKKDRAYVINQDHEKNKNIHWVSLFIDGNLPVYFDSFWN